MSKYKVGDKVVMEIISADQDEIKTYSVSGVDNNWRWRLPQNLLERYTEPLSTYTEPLEAKIRRQAAEITRLLAENKELKEQMKFDLPTLILEEDRRRMDINKARAEGAEAAWELARKIILPPSKGGMSSDDYVAIFGNCISEAYIMKNYTYSEAAAKVAEWEEGKEEIKVGDIIRSNEDSGFYALVVNIDKETQTSFLITENCSLTFLRLDQCFKTGRHIDGIEQMLKQIGEE